MTAPGERSGGGLGAVPGGPQKCAVAVSGRRPAVKAPFVPDPMLLVSADHRDDPQVVGACDHRSWGIVARRCF